MGDTKSSKERLDPGQVRHFWREMVADLAEHAPELEAFDRLMLTLQGLERLAEERVLPAGPLRKRHFGRANVIAAGGLSEMLAQQAPKGARRRTWFASTRRLLAEYARWTRAVVELGDRERAGGILNPRERQLLDAWLAVRSLGPMRIGFARGARMARDQLDVPPESEEFARKEALQELSLYRVALGARPGDGSSGTFRGEDGGVRVDHRGLRDFLAMTLGVRRRQPGDPTSVSAIDGGELEDPEDPADVLDAVDAAHAVECAERVQAWLAHRLTVAGTPAQRAVAKNFWRLMTEGLTISGLAREVGVPRSTLQRTFEATRDEFRSSFPDLA